jgi:hypothetical protein
MKGDRLFYAMWGFVLIFLGVAAALWLNGYPAEGVLIFFAGPGIILSLLGRKDNFKFYGGLALALVGILLYSFMSELNPAYTIIAIIIIIGGLLIWHGFGGEKNARS